MILPTSEFFPPPFTGSDGEVRSVVRSVARYMGVQADVDVKFSEDLDHAGAYYADDTDAGEPLVVAIDRADFGAPARLLAVIAHELGRVRLFGERRISPGRADHEPLTDLATIYFGMGIFTANAAFNVGRVSGYAIEPAGGWQSRRLGSMTEQMFGYALARYAVYRVERAPVWAKFLDTNPRVYMKQALRYLHHREHDVIHFTIAP